MYCTNKLLLLLSTLGFICIARVFCLTPVARNKRVPHRTSNDIYMDPCKANAFFGDISLADEDLNSFSVISKNSSNSTDDSLYEMQVEDPKAGVLTSKGFSEKTIHVDMRQNERNTHKSKRNKNKKRKLKKHKCPKPHIRCPKRDKECKKQRRLERLKCKKSRKHRVSRRKNKVKTDRAKGPKRPKRAATARPERLWEFGVIPYEIEANFSGQHKALFKLAMRHWENYTCVSFVEKQPEHVNYIVFTERPCGCCSFVGKRGSGAQAISIGKNCDKFGIVVHELGHVIGFWHEHTRPDRDDHVIIVKKNIMPGQEYNFNKLTESEVNSLGEEYDYGSIMHYATNTFARATYVDTILPRRKLEMIPLPEIGQRVRLSPGDIQQANKLYRCPTCGRTLQDSNAEFSYTPSESGNRVCQWRISATHGEKIVLNISSLDIPETTGCESDYLEIRDGHFIKSPLLGRFCGKSLPTTLISSDSRMWLEFKSSRGQGKGFSAQYEAICGGEITRENGRLTSPNYPDDYKANKECVWKITVEEGYSVALKFQSFEIENHDNCVYDYLEVRDGHEDNSPLIGKFCGYKIPEDIKSTGNRLYVKFFSDGSVQKAGFAASFVKENDECSTDTHGCEHFCVNTLGSFKCECRIGFELHSDGKKCEDACGGYIDHRNGTIQSPSFPDLYPANKMCVWQIVAPDQYRITLNMTHFDLEGNNQDCEYDYVRVSSGSEARPEIHGIFCGSTLPLPVTSESNMLRIEFNSDNSVQKTGFQAQFFTDMDECAFNNGECQHICKNTVGSYECACHNGYTLHENRHDCKEGGCQHTITDAVGEISSPNWPDYYPSRKDCAWHFSTTKGHRIRLTFTHFGLEPHQDCTYDHIEIFDGNSVNARSLGKFCGSSIPPPKTSTSNVMFMVFYSDASVQRKGFKATHKTVCGGQLDAEDSPNQLYSHAKYGDQNYDNKVECEWIITAPRRRKVKFYFVTFEIEDESECGYDNVEIYNGMQDSDSLIGRFCGSKVPHEIISDGPHLMVRFKSDDTINWKGFSAVYVAFQEEDPDGGATKESSTES